MTLLQVFSEWISMLCLNALEVVLVYVEDAKAQLVLSTEFLRMKLWNGLEENMTEQSTIDHLFKHIINPNIIYHP
jgi:hypothetical protein